MFGHKFIWELRAFYHSAGTNLLFCSCYLESNFVTVKCDPLGITRYPLPGWCFLHCSWLWSFSWEKQRFIQSETKTPTLVFSSQHSMLSQKDILTIMWTGEVNNLGNYWAYNVASILICSSICIDCSLATDGHSEELMVCS